MACEECRELATHAFRSAEDLVHAVRVAAEELDRGVLVREPAAPLGPAEQEAMDSSLASGALPNRLLYRFRCGLCGDRFTLSGDTTSGAGEWRREGGEGA